MKLMPSKLLFVVGCAACCAYAQDTETYQQQASLIKAPEAVLKLGTDLFGDEINDHRRDPAHRVVEPAN